MSTLSQDIDEAGEGGEEAKSEGRQKESGESGKGADGRKGGGHVFFPSPRALLFQKCLGLHSSTSAPLGLSAAS